MRYRCEATSVSGFIQQLAVGYIGRDTTSKLSVRSRRGRTRYVSMRSSFRNTVSKSERLHGREERPLVLQTCSTSASETGLLFSYPR
jgi:hypothetical protein